MNEPVEIYKRGELTVKIFHDDVPESPREFCDHDGVMVCWHGRHRLGDKHSYKTPQDWARSLVHEIRLDIGREAKAVNELDLAQCLSVLRQHGVVTLPLYLYDHGGLTMNTTGFSCPWDSGQVGHIYMLPETIEEIFGGDKDKARQNLVAQVKEYDYFLTGQVYGYTIEDNDGNQLVSEWGFIGEIDDVQEEANAAADRLNNDAGRYVAAGI